MADMEEDQRKQREEQDAQELAAMCHISLHAAQKALLAHHWNIDAALSDILDHPDKYKEQAPGKEAGIDPSLPHQYSPQRPLGLSDRSWNVLLAAQRELEDADALRKLKEEVRICLTVLGQARSCQPIAKTLAALSVPPILTSTSITLCQQQSMEAALELMRAEEAAFRRRDDEDASSRALAEALLAEEKQFQKRATEEEEATRKLLEAERLQRQRDLDNKMYACGICFCDYKIDAMYTLDDCSHRFVCTLS
jgi:hypothetical protein